MGRKKKTMIALKPFCFYCDKEFNNEMVLHQHQKAKHFSCNECNRRFATAPALDTHYFHIHKTKLNRVPNAKNGRELFDISIYGMDGVPIELINIKLNEKVEKERRKAERERARLEGNLEYIRSLREVEKEPEYKLTGQGGYYKSGTSINLTYSDKQRGSIFDKDDFSEPNQIITKLIASEAMQMNPLLQYKKN